MKEIKLGTLTNRKIGYGIVQPGSSVPYGVPVIKVNNIITGLYNINDLETTTLENDAKYKRTKLVGGELIISVVGTIGKTAIVPKSFAGCNLVRATCLIDIKDELLTSWVKYYIDSPKGQYYIHENLNTTVQPTLNVKSLVDMPIPMYSLEYMKKAVSILKSLDDKIEVNRQINDNLEQQAQALFKSWFVDFEPFKDQPFVESKLGMIPQGFSLKKLMDICTIKYGKGISKSELVNEGFPVFGGNGIIGFHEKYLYELPQILVSCRGAASGKIMESYPKSFVTSNSLVLELFNRLYYNYLKCYLMHNPLYDYATGSAQPQITIDNIKNVPILIPSKSVLEHVDYLFENIYKKQWELIQQSGNLAELRDTLLPKLMSGEINVNDVDA